MVRQLFIGLVAEGVTDIRFLESVVKRTFEDIVFECTCDMDIVLKVLNGVSKTGLSFVDFVESASFCGAEEFGITTLCVHSDADDRDNKAVYENKINPARQHLGTLSPDKYCLLLTPVVPVQMMEAWMLADKELLKKEIGTTMTDSELGINRSPEEFTDPKKVICEAIREAQKNTAKRRRSLDISELYLPIGQKVGADKLRTLESYRQFEEEVRATYRVLGFMH